MMMPLLMFHVLMLSYLLFASSWVVFLWVFDKSIMGFEPPWMSQLEIPGSAC